MQLNEWASRPLRFLHAGMRRDVPRLRHFSSTAGPHPRMLHQVALCCALTCLRQPGHLQALGCCGHRGMKAPPFAPQAG